MKSNYLKLILLFFFILFFSCKGQNNNKNITSHPDHKVNISYNNLEIYDPFDVKEFVKQSNPSFTIVSYINVSCPSCIEEIDSWKLFWTKFNNKNCRINLVFYSKDKFEYIKFLVESGEIQKFPFPFYLDVNESFLIHNTFMQNPKYDYTVLLDKDNVLISTGNPLHNKTISSEFTDIINKKY